MATYDIDGDRATGDEYVLTTAQVASAIEPAAIGVEVADGQAVVVIGALRLVLPLADEADQEAAAELLMRLRVASGCAYALVTGRPMPPDWPRRKYEVARAVWEPEPSP